MKQGKWKIKLEAYDIALLAMSEKILSSLAATNSWDLQGPIMLPTKKLVVTFVRGPTTHKEAMESYERRTHRRVYYINYKDDQEASMIRSVLARTNNFPSGVLFNMKPNKEASK